MIFLSEQKNKQAFREKAFKVVLEDSLAELYWYIAMQYDPSVDYNTFSIADVNEFMAQCGQDNTTGSMFDSIESAAMCSTISDEITVGDINSILSDAPKAATEAIKERSREIGGSYANPDVSDILDAIESLLADSYNFDEVKVEHRKPVVSKINPQLGAEVYTMNVSYLDWPMGYKYSITYLDNGDFHDRREKIGDWKSLRYAHAFEERMVSSMCQYAVAYFKRQKTAEAKAA